MAEVGAGSPVTVRHLLDALGEAMVTPLDAGAGLDAAVTDLVIHDSSAAPVIEPGDVVLAVGLVPAGAEGVALLRRADEAGAAAVVFRAQAPAPPSGPVDPVRAGGGTAVLVIDPELAWGQFFALARGLVLGATAADDSVPQPAGGDLFGLANAIADLVGGSVVLYNAQHEVLAYSNLDDDVDEVRRDTILGRRTPDSWIRRFRRDGVYGGPRPGAGVTRVEGYEGLRTRLRVAVRAGGEWIGEISVAEASVPFADGAEEALREMAQLAAPHFLRQRLAQDFSRSVRSSVLGSLLEGRGPVETHARRLGLAPQAAHTVIGFAVRPDEESTDAARRRDRFGQVAGALVEAFHRHAATLALGSTVYALVPTPPGTSRDRLLRLAEHVAAHAAALDLSVLGAVGRTAPSLADVAGSRLDVDQVVRVLGPGAAGEGAGPAGPDTRLVQLVENVWARVALLELRDLFAEQRRPRSQRLTDLLEHDAAHRTAFGPTLRTYLDCFGDVRTAAERLRLHPNSLRHRLQRLHDLFGVDLDDPAERLVLALELATGG